MKIAISSKGKYLSSEVSEVFGRCPYFIIAEIEDKKIVNTEVFENLSAKKMGGAGISAAQFVVDKGAKAVISTNIGPRAMDVIKQFNLRIYNASGGSVKEVLQKFIDGKLKEQGENE